MDGSDYLLSGDMQSQLLDTLDGTSLLYVEGPHRIWINHTPVHYFSLRLANDIGSKSTSEGILL